MYKVNSEFYLIKYNKKFDFIGNNRYSNYMVIGNIFILIYFLCSWVFFNCNVSAADYVSVLDILEITPTPESVDYVNNKKQFQLHTLLTEQRHPKTWNFSEVVQENTLSGLQMLNSVDVDIQKKLEILSKDTNSFDEISTFMSNKLLNGQKIFVYGCGATGRLAKQMESTFWRPFWTKIRNKKQIWAKINRHLPNIENQLIGEMTGGDRALISSLEGFEDLQLIGSLQIDDRNVKKGDIVIAVTEGGETSSVIGAILKAHDQWVKSENYIPNESAKHLFFVYNNPDEVLLPFDRSRKVLEEKGITKINLTTGPQAITGSTRMQATTIETYVVGSIIESAIYKVLSQFLNNYELKNIGFNSPLSYKKRFVEFSDILENVKDALLPLSELTDIEANTYRNNKYTTYYAEEGIVTVFTDSTERSPTFRLAPLDTILEKVRKSWIQVWTKADNQAEGWLYLLKRPFKGLSDSFYREHFLTEIDDPYLKNAALNSLKNAGDDQQYFYDFSFSKFNLENRNFKKDDLGVAVALSDEGDSLTHSNSYFLRFFDLVRKNLANAGFVTIIDKDKDNLRRIENNIDNYLSDGTSPIIVPIYMNTKNDPLMIKQNIAIKLILNTHSTAVMGILGKVVGNTMTNVSPSNLKLIGRATYLILSHVNDTLLSPKFINKYGERKEITYMEANAVLYDSIDFLKNVDTSRDQPAEVALSIVRILESLKYMKKVTNNDALNIVMSQGLANYLENI
jgi:N-acetylmuramic acid 6-phosphate (MurNAc-6-P) etherase